MKKNYLFIVLFLAALLVSANIKAAVIDVTDSIKNNDFEGDVAKWTAVKNNYSSFKQASGVFEGWNGDNGSSWFNCSQIIRVPAGVYRLTAAAFHRGYLNDITNVILYGTTTQKEYSVGVKSLKSETTAYGSTPGSMAAAKTAFDAGFWVNTVDQIVVTDEGDGKGTINVGIRNISQPIRATTATSGDIWTIWGNFHLYELTAADLDPMRDQVVANATALLAELTNYNDAGTLQAAINTLTAVADADLTSSSITTLETAMTAYKTGRIASATVAVPVDVTYLIKNPSFEDGQISVLATANGHYNQPKGWSLTYNTAVTNVNNNITIINNKVVPAGVAAGVVINPTEGSYSHVSRFRWTTNESYTISQVVKNLKAGKYKISADLGKLSVNGTAFFKAVVSGVTAINTTATFVAGPAFTNTSAYFDALNGDSLVISATMTQVGGEATLILDNIKLEYSGELPFVTPSESALAFTPTVREKSFNVKAGNITSDVTLATSGAFTLSKSSITVAEATATGGVDVTVTATSNTDILNDSIVITSGSVVKKIYLSNLETAISFSTAGLFYDQSSFDTTNVTISGDLFNDINLTAPSGIRLSESFISKTDAKAGKVITVRWDYARIENKYLYMNSGVKKDSILIFAVNDNLIQSWDGDQSTGASSKLTDFGWSQTLADGITAGPAAFGEYNTGGVRYVPAPNAAHTYKGKAWVGHRVAYLRSWGSPATNVYNLNVELEANKTYVFRGVSAWHNNETNPTFTYAVNTAKSNLGDTLGIQSKTCTVRQQGEDYGFEFTPATSGTHYLTVSSSAINDAICGADYLAIYPKVQLSTVNNEISNVSISVYPTVSTGLVNISTKANATIRLFDITGKLIETRVIAGSVESMQLPSQGIYLVEVNAGNESKVVKVISVK